MALPSPLDDHLRRMRREDLVYILPIEREAYPFPWSEKIFQDCLEAGYTGWVLEQTSGIVGYAMLTHAVGEAHLLNLTIARTWQGQGLGRYLLSAMIRWVGDSGNRVLFLETRASNQIALGLYQSTGFIINGRRPQYYPGHPQREDALLLSLHYN